jgi:hypothetical protein
VACSWNAAAAGFGSRGRCRGASVIRLRLKGARMGDRGGKKAKDKHQQQQVNKQKQKQQRKDDKVSPRTTVAETK